MNKARWSQSMPSLEYHHEMEVNIRKNASPSLAWTILEPDVFMQNAENPIAYESPLAGGLIHPGPMDVKFALIDYRDIGSVAASVLMESDLEKHKGKTYILTGSELFSYQDMAEVYTKVAGKEVPVKNVRKQITTQAS